MEKGETTSHCNCFNVCATGKALLLLYEKKCFLLLFIVTVTAVYAQVKQRDSLLNLLPVAKEDTNKVNLLLAY